MNRRRIIFFGGIIVLGIVIGIFCLPGSDKPTDREAVDARRGLENPGNLRRADEPPPADIGRTPGARAEELFKKALALTDPKEKLQTLTEAWNADPTGRWGGEAAFEIGNVCKAAGEPAKAKQWYVVAKRAPVSQETLAKLSAELEGVTEAEKPALAQMKMVNYKVQSGDSLWKIAKSNAITAGAIKRANNMTSDSLRVDQTLKFPKGPFDVLITKQTHLLQLLQEAKAVKVYEVGLGASESPTPTGTFTVSSKLIDPIWYSDKGRIAAGDPRNILGSRWIGFNGRIGIHGTRKADEATIGKDVSNGCVRMRDEEVKELYDYLVEGKSKVTIAD